MDKGSCVVEKEDFAGMYLHAERVKKQQMPARGNLPHPVELGLTANTSVECLDRVASSFEPLFKS